MPSLSFIHDGARGEIVYGFTNINPLSYRKQGIKYHTKQMDSVTSTKGCLLAEFITQSGKVTDRFYSEYNDFNICVIAKASRNERFFVRMYVDDNVTVLCERITAIAYNGCEYTMNCDQLGTWTLESIENEGEHWKREFEKQKKQMHKITVVERSTGNVLLCYSYQWIDNSKKLEKAIELFIKQKLKFDVYDSKFGRYCKLHRKYQQKEDGSWVKKMY